MNTHVKLEPELWLKLMFPAQAIHNGGIICRSVSDIDRLVGFEAFLSEVKRRGFTAVEHKEQVIIFCNQAPVIALV